MKKDTPFLAMLIVSLLASLIILASAQPIPFPFQRWDDATGLEVKFKQMGSLEEADTVVPDAPDLSHPLFAPVGEPAR